MSNIDHYMHAIFKRVVPTSVLVENAEKLKNAPKEEVKNLRERLAQEIEEKYPYKPGEDPEMPGIPIAEVSFTHPASTNIGYAARQFFMTKKDRMTMFELRGHLQIGDIQKTIDSKYRRCLAGRINIGFCHDNEFDEETYLRSCDRLDEYWSNLTPFLDEGKQLRIWYSNSPEELCGFYHLCTYLKKYDQDFFAVRLPEIGEHKGKPMKVYSWNQMSEDEIKKAADNTRLLTKEEIAENSKIWETLKKENAPLRVVINGQIISVSEDFYDQWIIDCIPKDEPISVKKTIDQFYKHIKTVDSGWIIHRIDELIRFGKVETVKEHEHVWEQLIKLAK